MYAVPRYHVQVTAGIKQAADEIYISDDDGGGGSGWGGACMVHVSWAACMVHVRASMQAGLAWPGQAGRHLVSQTPM